eukprot:jgi/Ulvmu1/2705/UM014_0161.1
MDPRFLQRGQEFSAGYRRERYEQTLVEGTDFSLPRNQFIEDSMEASAIHAPSATDPIPASNKGYKLLQLMGWSGTGLGKQENGLTAPVDVGAVDTGSRMGLGRAQLEQSIVEAETSTRKQLQVEQQMRENDTQREQRVQRAEQREMVEKQVADMNRTFYCEVCCKQYKSIAELEEHLSSYNHHHRKRLQELKQMELERTRDVRSKKESKRQAKEQARLMKQIAAAHKGKASAAPAQGAERSAQRPGLAPPLPNAPPLPSAPPLPGVPPPPDAPPLPDEPLVSYAAPVPGAPPLPPAPPPDLDHDPRRGPSQAPPPLPPSRMMNISGVNGNGYGGASQSFAQRPPPLPAGQAPSSQPSHPVPPAPRDCHTTTPHRAPEAKTLSLSLSNKSGRMPQKPLPASTSLAKPRSGTARLSMFAADDSD